MTKELRVAQAIGYAETELKVSIVAHAGAYIETEQKITTVAHAGAYIEVETPFAADPYGPKLQVI